MKKEGQNNLAENNYNPMMVALRRGHFTGSYMAKKA